MDDWESWVCVIPHVPAPQVGTVAPTSSASAVHEHLFSAQVRPIPKGSTWRMEERAAGFGAPLDLGFPVVVSPSPADGPWWVLSH